MSLFSRKNAPLADAPVVEIPAADVSTEAPEPSDLLIRFHNQAGGAVDVTGSVHRQSSHWTCGQSSDRPHADYLWSTREKANTHAGICRGAYHRTA
ncbi:hypothetical protein ACFVIL_23400 [Streptomyces sp. NPDC127159]|uniref:hypothetical protein n=1 Tax=unclassified Streptomyces TaxID=2593676 RepID=UPI00363004CC